MSAYSANVQKYYTQAAKPSSTISFTKQPKPQTINPPVTSYPTSIRPRQPYVSAKQPVKVSQLSRRLSLQGKTPRSFHTARGNNSSFLEGVQIGGLRHSTEPQGLYQQPIKKAYQQYQKGTQIFQFKKKAPPSNNTSFPNVSLQSSSHQDIQHYISKLNNSQRLISQIQSLIDTTDSSPNTNYPNANNTGCEQNIENIILQTQHQQQFYFNSQQNSIYQQVSPSSFMSSASSFQNSYTQQCKRYEKNQIFQQTRQYPITISNCADDFLDYLKIPQQFQSSPQYQTLGEGFANDGINLRHSSRSNLSNTSSKSKVTEGSQMMSYYDLHQRLLKDKDSLSTFYKDSLGTTTYLIDKQDLK